MSDEGADIRADDSDRGELQLLPDGPGGAQHDHRAAEGEHHPQNEPSGRPLHAQQHHGPLPPPGGLQELPRPRLERRDQDGGRRSGRLQGVRYRQEPRGREGVGGDGEDHQQEGGGRGPVRQEQQVGEDPDQQLSGAAVQRDQLVETQTLLRGIPQRRIRQNCKGL